MARKKDKVSIKIAAYNDTKYEYMVSVKSSTHFAPQLKGL